MSPVWMLVALVVGLSLIWLWFRKRSWTGSAPASTSVITRTSDARPDEHAPEPAGEVKKRGRKDGREPPLPPGPFRPRARIDPETVASKPER
jgi:hypothetical protein